MIVWKLFHEALPTQKQFWRKCVTMMSACPFCPRHSKTLNHIMIGCDFSRKVWDYFLEKLDIRLNLNMDIVNLIVTIMH